MFCINCGKNILPESKFCSFCGSSNDLATISQPVTKASPSPKSSKYLSIYRDLPQSKKNIFWIVIIILIVVLEFGPKLKSNSGNSVLDGIVGQVATQQIPGLVMATVPEVEPSCSEALTSSTMWCTFGFAVKNSGSTATRLYGDFYALVDGLTFKSTDIFGGITYVSTDINPGQTQSTMVTFEVPRGSTISNVFIADSAESGLTGAKVVVDLNIVAN